MAETRDVDEILLIVHPGWHVWNREGLALQGRDYGLPKKSSDFLNKRLAYYGKRIKDASGQGNAAVVVILFPESIKYRKVCGITGEYWFSEDFVRRLKRFKAFCEGIPTKNVFVIERGGYPNNSPKVLETPEEVRKKFLNKGIRLNNEHITLLSVGEWRDVCETEFLEAFERYLKDEGVRSVTTIPAHNKSVAVFDQIYSRHKRRQVQRQKKRKAMVKRISLKRRTITI